MTDAPTEIDALIALLPRATTVARLWAAPRLEGARRRLAQGLAVDRTVAECRAKLDLAVVEVERRAALPLTIAYPELPVAAARDQILATVARSPAFVLTGETGSGKTTQLPKMLLEAGCGRRGMVAVTQPRRVAAYAIAERLRDECQASEAVVSHSVRFDDRSGADTIIRVVTDGLLLAEASHDPDLARYDAIIVDEAHERSLNIDLLLALLKRLRVRRPDLVVAVSSASIEAERFAAYLGTDGVPAPIVAVGGRTFPVEVRWREPGDDDVGYLSATIAAIREIHDARQDGDVLVFLPTERDILDAARRLHDLPAATVLPLFSRLTPKEQRRVFEPARGRKVVLATNVAETSLTIPGIVYVVDAGLARIKRWNASSRTERLPVEAVAQASCVQRAGRAGRVRPGICIRLYSEDDFLKRPPYTDPEILRANLAGVVVQCLSLDLGDAEALPWLDQPTPQAWRLARGLLEELGAIIEDEKGLRLSAMGRELASLPTDPTVARMLIAGTAEGVAHEACTIAAFLSVQDPRVRPLGQESKADSAHRRFAHESGDLATILNLWDAFNEAASWGAKARLCESAYLGLRRMREWSDVRHQLWRSLREVRKGGKLPVHGFAPGEWPVERVHRAVLAGRLGNVLLYDKTEKVYRAGGDRKLVVHPGSALRSGKQDDGKKSPPPPPWLVACEIVETSRLFARLCAPIDPEWVVSLVGDRAKVSHRDAHWHPRRRQVVCTETISWRGLPVRDGRLVPYERVDPRAATLVFIEQALVGDGGDTLERDFPLIAANRALVRQARGLRDRLRDPDLWIDDPALTSFYRERLGVGVEVDAAQLLAVASSDALNRWLKQHGADRLRLTLADLVDPAVLARAERDYPETARFGAVDMPIRYRFAPGDADDGATLVVGEERMDVLEPERLDWLVPGFLPEAVEHLLRALPKDARKRLHPIAESAQRLATAVRQHAGRLDLVQALATEVREELAGAGAPNANVIPEHLRLRIEVRSKEGKVIHAGRDRAFVLGQMGGDDRLSGLRAMHASEPARTWPALEGTLPRALGDERGPWLALGRCRDVGGQLAAHATVYAGAESAAAWHDDGVDALLEASLAMELEAFATAPTSPANAALIERGLNARLGALRRACAVGTLAFVARGRVADAAAFAELRQRAVAALGRPADLDAWLARVAERADKLRGKLKQGTRSLGAAATLRSVGQALDRLLSGWPGRLAWPGARRLDGWLDALLRRVDQAAANDAIRINARCDDLIDEWEHALTADAARWAAPLGLVKRLRELAVDLEDATAAVAMPGATSGSAFAVQRLRGGVAEVAKRIAGERSAVLAARDRLMRARETVGRIAEASLRDRLARQLDERLKAFPELGWGVDLAAQRRAVVALAERAEAAASAIAR